MTFLDRKCGYCGKPYRARPCGESDHYRACIDLAYDEAEKAFTSSACLHPAQQQATISPEQRGRRHPYDGDRPEFSGYCVSDKCACPCHYDDALPEIAHSELAGLET